MLLSLILILMLIPGSKFVWPIVLSGVLHGIGTILYYTTSAKIGALRAPYISFLGCIKRRSYILMHA